MTRKDFIQSKGLKKLQKVRFRLLLPEKRIVERMMYKSKDGGYFVFFNNKALSLVLSSGEIARVCDVYIIR